MDTAKDTAQSAMHTASDVAGQARDKAAEYVGQAREKVADWAGDVSDAARNAGQRVQGWAGDAFDVTADSMGDFGREVTSLVRRYPIPALMIGFGVGLLLGRAARA